jgi:HSP20 family protein
MTHKAVSFFSRKVNHMALIRWEPVPMNRLFNSLFDTPTVQNAGARRWLPATDLIESDTHYVLRTDLPGVSEDDINVELDHNVLTISGERKSEHQDRKPGYHRVERSSGSFRRSVRVPEGVDGEAITATFDRGVLEVSVPKPEQAQAHKVQITVGAGESEAIEGAEAPAVA